MLIVSIAGLFACGACLLSLMHIIDHLRHYTQPAIQQRIIRILVMVPVYAVDSFFSLAFHQYAVYGNTLRDAYEAFVIYSFLSLLIQYGGGDDKLQEMLYTKRRLRQPVPFCCLSPIDVSDQLFLRRIKQGVLQFTVVKPLTAIITIILMATGTYGDEGSMSEHTGYLWILIINNLSISISMYCLIIFYMATWKDLRVHQPLDKLLCIKAVVFFSFWQGVAITLLTKYDVIQSFGTWSKMEMGVYFQDALICVEMFFAAIAHRYSFSVEPFIITGATGTRTRRTRSRSQSRARSHTRLLAEEHTSRHDHAQGNGHGQEQLHGISSDTPSLHAAVAAGTGYSSFDTSAPVKSHLGPVVVVRLANAPLDPSSTSSSTPVGPNATLITSQPASSPSSKGSVSTGAITNPVAIGASAANPNASLMIGGGGRPILTNMRAAIGVHDVITDVAQSFAPVKIEKPVEFVDLRERPLFAGSVNTSSTVPPMSSPAASPTAMMAAAAAAVAAATTNQNNASQMTT